MKNYFNFNLTGKKFLPVWLLFLFLYLIPYITIITRTSHIQVGKQISLIFPMMILLIVVAFVLNFFMTKLAIENVSFKDKSVVFTGTFGQYIKIVLLGFFLSIITLGIYGAWFIRDVFRFFIDNSSYDSNALKFKGKGGKLFVIMLLTIVVPLILLALVLVMFRLNHTGLDSTIEIIQQLVITFIMIPYLYFVYKWMFNVDYKDFHISWKTNFWSSCGKIIVELFLSVVTLGIYSPLATLRLYKYFADRTLAKSEVKTLTFGYDIDQLNDFLFLWGQLLLTMITLGIYFPWAFSKAGKRVLSKTYLVEE